MDILASKRAENLDVIRLLQRQCKNFRKQLRDHGIKEYCSSQRSAYERQYPKNSEVFKLMCDVDSTRQEIYKLELRDNELRMMMYEYKRKPHIEDALTASKRKKDAKENKRAPDGHTFSIFPYEVRDFIFRMFLICATIRFCSSLQKDYQIMTFAIFQQLTSSFTALRTLIRDGKTNLLQFHSEGLLERYSKVTCLHGSITKGFLLVRITI